MKPDCRLPSAASSRPADCRLPTAVCRLAALAALALITLAGCSTFNAAERCQVTQYQKAHPDWLKHKLELDT